MAGNVFSGQALWIGSTTHGKVAGYYSLQDQIMGDKDRLVTGYRG